MKVVVRDADPQRADAMALLQEASVDARALYPELFDGVARVATNEPLAVGAVYVVAYVDERPLACGALRRLDDTVAEVRRMYVHRAHRRQGLARAVLQHLVQEAIRMGYGSLVLETGYKQLPAMQLYEANGFTRIQPFGDYVDDPTSVCYRQLLGAET